MATAASIVALCAFAGLVMDSGFAEYTRRQAQAAADAGAKAAAFSIIEGRTGRIRAAALLDAANNGFRDGSGGVTVTVNYPPVVGPHAGNRGYAEVVVEKAVATTFLSVFGYSAVSVSARAVGGGGSAGAGCVYALGPEGVSGDFQGSCAGRGVARGRDPFAGRFTPPIAEPCTANGWRNSGTVIWPGTYCGGISVSGSDMRVTALPGTYVLLGGGLTVSGGASLNGSGVTFFNSFDGGRGYRPISLVSGGVRLSAPASGMYEGLLFWQDPSLPPNHWADLNVLRGGESGRFEGILYFPNSAVEYQAGGGAGYTSIAAARVRFAGPSELNANYSGLAGGSPVKTSATLVE